MLVWILQTYPLINTDLRLLSKILAIHLTSMIGTLYNSDQTGFIPGRSMNIFLQRLFTNLQFPHASNIPWAVVALDTYKAFNSIEWPYLTTVLRKFIFENNFITWVQILFTQPTVHLIVNVCISISFSIQQRTRQGCLLSPSYTPWQ